MATMDDVLKELRSFAKQVLKRFDGIDKQFEGIDNRFDGVDDRFDGVDDRFDRIEKEVKSIKLDRKLDWKEQREFNKRIEKKVDMLDDSVKALDKRVRTQDDMPERLRQVESDTYELKRRVTKVEARV